MRIKSLGDIEPLIVQIRDERYWSGLAFMEFYRGHGKTSYKLHPQLLRIEKSIDEIESIEQEFLNRFIKTPEIKEVIQESFIHDKYSYSDEWYNLMQAQHLRLITRILDWTIKWEVAMFFAVENELYHGVDGTFWVFKCPYKYIINDADKKVLLNQSPFKVKQFYMINFPFFAGNDYKKYTGERRRARQNGRFSIQPISVGKIPLEEQEDLKKYLMEITIDGGSKKDIKKELADREINKEYIYYHTEEKINEIIENINNDLTK